jgi:hypothetical protein
MKNIILLFISFMFFLTEINASYTILSINTTVTLNQNTSAYVNEVLKVAVSNISASQYLTNRLALNLSLSNWQVLIGPELTEHILNPKGMIYGLKFLPGPLVPTNNGKVAYLQMSYYVSNVTTMNVIGPRAYQYSFNRNVFNFEAAKSGIVLGPNTTLNIVLPKNSQIISVYPLPDYPALSFAQNYRNVTELSWYQNEPLSAFTLVYVVHESLQDEVLNFFLKIYNLLGIYTYIIIILLIVAFLIYMYFKIK